MDEDTRKHLEFIEAIIARMAGNSFLLKAWSVTLVAALFALAVKDANRIFAMIALLPALSFWGLDAFYLRRERRFRCLYDDVRKPPSERTAPIEPFSLSTRAYRREPKCGLCSLWACAVIGFHGPVIAVVVAVVLILGVPG